MNQKTLYEKNISYKEALIKTLMNNQNNISLVIPNSLCTEYDLNSNNIVIQNKEYIKEVHTLKRGTFKTINDSNYLISKTIKKKTTLFNQLKRFLKRGYYMSIKNNQLILYDCINSTFSFDLKKLEV